MDFSNRWGKIERIGEGGQGRVYRVIDISKFGTEQERQRQLRETITHLSVGGSKEDYESFIDVIKYIVRMEEPLNQGALKVLHKPKDVEYPEKAKERIKNEIEAMSKLSGPSAVIMFPSTSTDAPVYFAPLKFLFSEL